MTQPNGADGPGEPGQAQDSQADDIQPDDDQPDDTGPGSTAPGGTAPDDDQADDTQPDDYGVRAETYLRLLAEAELRRALARPRSPVQRIPPTAALWAANAVGTLTGSAQLAARSAGPAAAWAGQGAVRFLAPPARQVGRALPPSVRRAGAALGPQAQRARQAAEALAPPASQVTGALAPRARRARRAVAQAGWQARIAADRLGDRLIDRLTGGSRADDQASENALERVREAAHVLVAAGALSEDVARSVGLGFGYALASRGLADDFSTWDDRPYRPYDFSPAATPAGPILVAGIGAQVELAADGYRARTHLLALVLGPGTALLTTVSWLTESPPGPPEEDPGWQFDDGLGGLVQRMNGQVTDNRGGTYQLRMGGGAGSSNGPWEARLELSPEPSAGLDWLEIRLAPDQDPVRVDLTKAARDEADPKTARPPAGPAQRAERIIDAASERLLGELCPDPEHEHEHEHDLTGIVGLAEALRAAGVLPAGSPALARLRTLIRRMGLTVPAELAGPAGAGSDEAAELPEAWLAGLSPRRWPGLSGDACAGTAVAVLPELDGVRCVIAGLVTSTHSYSVTMQVLAWGWPWHAGRHGLWQPFTWWARDDAGRWYQGVEEGYSSGGDLAEMQIALAPALHPEATSLELILSGASGQVSATVPVTWARMP